MKLSKSWKRRVIDAVHYVSSSFLSKNRKFISESPYKLLTILAIPAGYVLYKKIVAANRKDSTSTEL